MKTISVREAIDLILGCVSPMSCKDIPIQDGLGFVLGEDVVCRDDVPYQDNSAMDGYAIRSQDIENASQENPVSLRALPGMIAAGEVFQEAVSQSSAIKSMTGATIPSGSDAVVPIEAVIVQGETVTFSEPTDQGRHIRLAGEDMAASQTALTKGLVLDPAAIGLAVLAGKPAVSVHKRPRIAVFTSGDELIGPAEDMKPGSVRNSNSYVLIALLEELGCEVIDLGVAKDQKEDILERLSMATNADAIITSGGVSMGEKDLIRGILEDEGMKVKFWGVDVKPGKPFLFGLLEGKPVFGLPGNPVSTHACFEIFVRPAIRKMQGRKRIFRPVVSAKMNHEIKRKPGRPEFMRVKIETQNGERTASLTRMSQGSGVMSSFLEADGFLYADSEVVYIPEGESVRCLSFHEKEVTELGI